MEHMAVRVGEGHQRGIRGASEGHQTCVAPRAGGETGGRAGGRASGGVRAGVLPLTPHSRSPELTRLAWKGSSIPSTGQPCVMLMGWVKSTRLVGLGSRACCRGVLSQWDACSFPVPFFISTKSQPRFAQQLPSLVPGYQTSHVWGWLPAPDMAHLVPGY